MSDDRLPPAKKKSDEGGIKFTDEAFISELRGKMLKFATLQLSDPHLAEDAVQEALIGALKNADSFHRRSALKTWVFAILKNKIADVLRQKTRRSEVSQLSTDVEGDDNLDKLFNARGFWQADEKPVSWSQPMECVKNEHFWLVFEACLEHLPHNQAQLFMMREFIQLEATEICKTLEISTSNLHVLLYRARLRLRECLENNWFIDGERS
jgi:RNA polymerase sigma-70 factor (TIGR02943 family)